MPQSLARILLHIIFSTKNRESYFIDQAIRQDLHAYLAATANHLGCQTIRVGGIADHVHVVCSLGRLTSAMYGIDMYFRFFALTPLQG